MPDLAGNGVFCGVCRIRPGEKDSGDVCGGYDFREIDQDVHGDQYEIWEKDSGRHFMRSAIVVK